MRRILVLACRAFPPDHRARRSDEVVDTALLAADGSHTRLAREALSLLAAGLRQRLRAESHRSLRSGVGLLAGVLATVNLAVALAGIAACVHPPRPDFVVLGLNTAWTPYVLDWWWVAFAVAAAAVVFGLARGNRRLAVGAALANAGLLAYDAIVVAHDGLGHFDVFTYLQTSGFPGGRHWLAPAVVLALATAAAPFRPLPLTRLPLELVAVLLLVVVSRDTGNGFVFLCWLLGAIVVLAMAFGALLPRLALVSVGGTLAAIPGVVAHLTRPDPVTPYASHHHPAVIAVVVAALALGVGLPLAQLTRRRLA